LDGGHGVDHAREQFGADCSLYAPAHAAVVDDHAYVVARAARECAEQQRRLERRVDAGFARYACRSGTPAVDDDDDASVALGSPGAHDELLPARGVDAASRGAPVDGAHIVAPHILAQRVELGALPPNHDARAPVELPQA